MGDNLILNYNKNSREESEWTVRKPSESMREMANWVLKAKEGKASDVENFLPGGKKLVDDKPETVSWHAYN